MKNKFFKIMCEELENEKNSKKIDILKTSLFFIPRISDNS